MEDGDMEKMEAGAEGDQEAADEVMPRLSSGELAQKARKAYRYLLIYMVVQTAFCVGCFYQLGKTASEHTDNIYTQNHWKVNKPYLISGLIGALSMWTNVLLPRGKCCCASFWKPFFRYVRICNFTILYLLTCYY